MPTENITDEQRVEITMKFLMSAVSDAKIPKSIENDLEEAVRQGIPRFTLPVEINGNTKEPLVIMPLFHKYNEEKGLYALEGISAQVKNPDNPAQPLREHYFGFFKGDGLDITKIANAMYGRSIPQKVRFSDSTVNEAYSKLKFDLPNKAGTGYRWDHAYKKDIDYSIVKIMGQMNVFGPEEEKKAAVNALHNGDAVVVGIRRENGDVERGIAVGKPHTQSIDFVNSQGITETFKMPVRIGQEIRHKIQVLPEKNRVGDNAAALGLVGRKVEIPGPSGEGSPTPAMTPGDKSKEVKPGDGPTTGAEGSQTQTVLGKQLSDGAKTPPKSEKKGQRV